MNIRNFQEANEILASFVPNTRALTGGYTLDRMRLLMNFLDNPQNQLRIIHVAGTSGKTSTSYYAASLLRAANKKVGLTVSPHVDEVNERVQINLTPLAEHEYCHELSEFLTHIESSQIKPSYFELLIAFAFWEFVRQNVDYAVIEVGLGGLLDGTNVINRSDKVCIITDIGLDHIDRLGETLGEIANQKAGIIQPNNEVYCHRQDQVILDAIADRCAQQNATLHLVEKDNVSSDLVFLPIFQQRNFSLAQAATTYVLERDHFEPLGHEQLITAAHTLVPGRMESIPYHGKTIILDGAHNAQKLHALMNSITTRFPEQSIAALVSFVGGRSYRLDSSIKELSSGVDSVIVTAFHGTQDLPHGPVEPSSLLDIFGQHGVHDAQLVAEPAEAFAALLDRPEQILLVTGSFFLINDVRHMALTLEQS